MPHTKMFLILGGAGFMALLLPAQSAHAQEVDSQMRFRGGASATLGTFVPGPMINFGINGRAGLQIDQLFAVYGTFGYNAGFWFGVSFDGGNTDVRTSGVGYWHLGALAEVTLGDVFSVAAGPLIAGGGWGTIRQVAGEDGASQQAVATGGVMPGLDFRVGVGFGSPRESGRRHQFTLSIGGQLLFGKASEVSQAAGSGGVSQSVSVGDAQIGFAPMIFIGYDAK